MKKNKPTQVRGSPFAFIILQLQTIHANAYPMRIQASKTSFSAPFINHVISCQKYFKKIRKLHILSVVIFNL